MNRNSNSDSFSPGYCEYLVPGFASGKIKLLRTVALVVGLALVVLLFGLLSKIPQVFAVWFVLICALEVILFRCTVREFEYTVAMGEMTVEIIYGKKWRKKIANVRIADAERVFPVDSFNDVQIANLKADKVIYASPKKSDYMYCLYMKDSSEKNARLAIVFSSCKKLNDSIKFYNRTALTERK